MPTEGKQLGNDWYRKFVASSTAYGYQNSDRGSTVDIDGRSNGIDAGMGRTWRLENGSVDLSATVGYRYVKLSPYTPTNDKAGELCSARRIPDVARNKVAREGSASSIIPIHI